MWKNWITMYTLTVDPKTVVNLFYFLTGKKKEFNMVIKCKWTLKQYAASVGWWKKDIISCKSSLHDM